MNDFNKCSLYTFLLLVSIPFLYGAFSKSVTSFFNTFDNLSIPVFIGTYSFFWIRFSRYIKDAGRQILRYDNEVKTFSKKNIYSKPEFAKNIEADNKLTQLKIKVSESKTNLEHINYGLQFALCFWAGIKIIEFFLPALKAI